jgi:hypothetical protein
MQQTGVSPPQQANPALLHRFLGIGLLIVAGALIITRQSAAMAESEPGSLLPAYVIAGVSFLMCAAALMILKPLVPRREGKTREAYWADRSVAGKALSFWFILEGAGVMASVSYFLGGGMIAAALIVLAVAVYWLNGPRVFTGD